MDSTDTEPVSRPVAAALVRMPTGAKVFLILVGALLPLALIALFTTGQTARNIASEARERLGVVARESSGMLENLLTDHLLQLREGLDALERNPRDAASCTRLVGTFATQRLARFAILSSDGGTLCGQAIAEAESCGPRAAAGTPVVQLTADSLIVRIGGNRGLQAVALYPRGLLSTIVRPSGFVPEYGAALVHGGERLTLRALHNNGPLERLETVENDLGIDHLALDMSMPGTPMTSPLVIATVLLVLMWIAAAAIGWFVVDILLIRPLRQLRSNVANYRPGEVIDTRRLGAIPAQEIRELGDTFSQISRTVQAHEADLAQGLVRQTKLTREVHHRVKNNLQVISSLINFHARAARSDEAADAYASIQRRVDALAVVHRHHYAEMEENRGLELRPVISELAANLRATAPMRADALGITLEIESLLVTQDTAIAVAFLLTELVELAMTCNGGAQIRISIKAPEAANRAVLRVSSPALVGGTALEELLEKRYGRVLSGLARQLRTQLHHDPLTGAYEAMVTINGRP